MKRTRPLILLGIAVYLLALFRQFPADVATGLFVPEELKLYGVSGTVWNGRADAVAPPGGLTLGATDWQVSPLWLLTGRVKGEFGTQLDDTSRLNAGFSKPFLGNALALTDAQGILNLDLLPAEMRPNGVTGRVGMSFDRIVLDAMWPQEAQGSINLVDLSVQRPRRIELGTFEVSFDGTTEDPLVGAITDTRSDISIDGTLALAQDRSYLLEARLMAGPNADPDVAQTLTFLGEENADGSVDVSYPGTVQ